MSSYTGIFKRMSLRCGSFINDNRSLLMNIPGAVDLSTEINEANDVFNTISQKRQIKKGVTKITKNNYKELLWPLAEMLVIRLKAYAIIIKSSVLLKQVNYSTSKIKNMTDEKMYSFCQSIYTIAMEYIDGLATYNITPEWMDNFQVAIDNYKTAYNNNELGGISNKQLTINETDTIKLQQANWEKMDIYMELFRDTNADFYKNYKIVRKLEKLGNGSLMLKIKVIDASTEKVLPNVTLTISPAEGTINETIVKRTATGGGSYISDLNDGTYIITAKRPGYTDTTVSVSVVYGELKTVVIKMEMIQ